MKSKTRVRRATLPLGLLAGIAVILAITLPRLGAARQDQQSQQGQQNQQDQQSQQSQQNQDQTQTDQQPKKKKGGIFGGLKSVTTQSSDQNKATASAGTKGVGEGKAIGEMTPTSADRQQVTDMENFSVPQGDLKKFQDDGRLQPKQ